MTSQMMSKELQQCIDACKDCQRCCVALERSGGVDAKTIQAAKDCAEICQTCSSFVMRESCYATDIRKLCAQVCKACATACDKVSQGNIAKECGAACRRCAETCVNVGSPVHA